MAIYVGLWPEPTFSAGRAMEPPSRRSMWEKDSNVFNGFAKVCTLPFPELPAEGSELLAEDTDAAAVETAEGEEPSPAGLHAKLFLAISPTRRHLWIGSANATRRAWDGRNFEVVAATQIGRDAADALLEFAANGEEFKHSSAPSKAAIVIAHHFAKGDSTVKNAIDRMSGAGAWARDPDSLVVMTPHEEDGCFTVSTTVRNLPQVDEFVVEWVYLIEDDPYLAPAIAADLEEPRHGLSTAVGTTGEGQAGIPVHGTSEVATTEPNAPLAIRLIVGAMVVRCANRSNSFISPAISPLAFSSRSPSTL